MKKIIQGKGEGQEADGKKKPVDARQQSSIWDLVGVTSKEGRLKRGD